MPDRTTARLGLLLAPLLLLGSCDIAPKQSESQMFNADTETFIEKVSNENPKIANLFASAHGYAVFPVVGQGGLLIAGGFGRGAVYEDGSLIGYARVGEHSIGAVLGGEKWSLLIFFQNEAALSEFTAGKFAWDAKANAVAGTAGASDSTNYSDGVIVTRIDPAGLMGNVSAGFSNYQYLSVADAEKLWKKEAADREKTKEIEKANAESSP